LLPLLWLLVAKKKKWLLLLQRLPLLLRQLKTLAPLQLLLVLQLLPLPLLPLLMPPRVLLTPPALLLLTPPRKLLTLPQPLSRSLDTSAFSLRIKKPPQGGFFYLKAPSSQCQVRPKYGVGSANIKTRLVSRMSAIAHCTGSVVA
jgi:hypothetical protein